MLQTIDPHHPDLKARRIRAQVPVVLRRWGLLPRFKRWRLTQDPSTGMIVLFGILNNKYIATHTSIPFSNYFDPRLLHDLAKELQVQVVSCNTDGLRYAFILDRGQIDKIPTHIDFPFLDGDKLVVRVVYDSQPIPEMKEIPISLAPPVAAENIDDQILIRKGVGAFLKVFDDIKLKGDTASKLPAQSLPEVVLIEEEEFNTRIAEHEVARQRYNHIKQMLGGSLARGHLEISDTMQQAMMYALVNGGKLYRFRGGFWAMENWHEGQVPWFSSSTIKALVSRGLMSYSEWQKDQKGSFPVMAVVLEPSDERPHPAT